MESKGSEAAKAQARRGGRPTREASQRLTQSIVEVATRLFTETSFESTSVDQIVAEARISKQTFYSRFKSKEELFAAVTRKGADDVLQSIVQGPWACDAIDVTLVNIGKALLKRAMGSKDMLLHRVIYAEAQRFPVMARAFHQNSFVRTSEFLREVFERAMANGQVRSGDAHFLARQFLHSVVNGPVHEAMMSGQGFDSEQDAENHVRQAVDLLLEGCSMAERTRRGSPSWGEAAACPRSTS